MATCNTTQNEVGGKQLLLKVCEEVTGSSSSGDASLTITAHNLKVGDLVRALDVGSITTLTAAENEFYFVKTVEDANTVELSATRNGAAIVLDATEASLELEVFRNLGGIRSKSMSFNSEGIDITNQDSDEWSKMLDQAGVRNFEFSGGGVYTNEDTFQDLRQQAMENKLVCLMIIDVKADRIYVGCFKITSISLAGEYNAEATYEISASSSGEVLVVVPS